MIKRSYPDFILSDGIGCLQCNNPVYGTCNECSADAWDNASEVSKEKSSYIKLDWSLWKQLQSLYTQDTTWHNSNEKPSSPWYLFFSHIRIDIKMALFISLMGLLLRGMQRNWDSYWLVIQGLCIKAGTLNFCAHFPNFEQLCLLIGHLGVEIVPYPLKNLYGCQLDNSYPYCFRGSCIPLWNKVCRFCLGLRDTPS